MNTNVGQCQALTSRGNQCINRASGGWTWCASHDPVNQCSDFTAAGKPCRRMKSYGTDRCSKHQQAQ